MLQSSTHQVVNDSYAGTVKVIQHKLKLLLLEKIEKDKLYYYETIDSRYNISRPMLIEKMSKLGSIISSDDVECVVGENFVLIPFIVDSGNENVEDRGIMFNFYCRYEDKDSVGEKVQSVFHVNLKTSTAMKMDWAIQSKGDLHFVEVHNILDEVIHDEAYPYLNDSVDGFISDYLLSDASILILMGKPGLGKTRLLRYIMQKICVKKGKDTSVLYTMDDAVFSDDRFFLRFLTNGYDAMVLEDVDLNLKSRANGNAMMHKLLAGADGFVRNQNKKIILTTNLTNINDIDEALLREGRCYAYVVSKMLDREEALALLGKLNSVASPAVIDKYGDKITVANVYQASKISR
jgi:hypothetical protein